MELTRDNNYSIADDTVLNVTSLMQCTDAQRLSLDEMSFGEFTSGNVPTLLTGSRATVNGALFGPAAADGVPLYIANAAGSTFQDVSAAPADTTLYLCLVPGTDTSTYALKACASVYYNAERRGWYETGSQVRVFGECRKVGGAWPVAYKRRYFHPSVVEEYLKTYADGLEINARQILPSCTRGRVGTVYSDSTSRNWAAGTTQLFKIRTDYPAMIECALTCKTYVSGVAPTGRSIGGIVVSVYAIDDSSGADIGLLSSHTIPVPSEQSAAVRMPLIASVPVGSFAVRLTTATADAQYYAATGTIGLNTTAIEAYIRNPNGNRVGAWGAVI